MSQKFLENKEVSDEELQKVREELPKDKRLVEDEKNPNHFKILTRLNG